MRPTLALTLGDPAGIGGEIILKALALLTPEQRQTITVVGERRLLEWQYQTLRQTCAQSVLDPAEVKIHDCAVIGDPQRVQWGVGSALTGEASFRYVQEAIAGSLDGRWAGIVTAPIAKWTWHKAGFHYPGQTEVLATLSQAETFGMLFVARSPHTHWVLRMMLATTHIPLASVPERLSATLVQDKLALFRQSLEHDFGLTAPRIAVAGLNPHSGEGGSLGSEEVTWLQALLDRDPQVQGAIPADTLWVDPAQAWWQGTAGLSLYDGYLALYHDQGLIPVKMLAFDQAVNMTVGLPFVRTSPDHGTAFAIAGQGIARAHSLMAALEWAETVAVQRQSRGQPLLA